MKRLLAVFAHPDDEAFGPGGTFALYGKRSDIEMHLLVATRGEAGQWDDVSKSKADKDIKIHHVREEEVKRSSKFLGFKKLEFMDFKDGTLCNNLYHKLAGKIADKITDFKPEVIVTNERLGVSGHLDHIAVAMTTTFAFRKTKIAHKLYYHCLPKNFWLKLMTHYFIYFPEGYTDSEITTRINYSSVSQFKKKAMLLHESQLSDAKNLLFYERFRPKVDHFILQHFRGVRPKFPETDLFEEIG